jgi:flagellum-specific peptidoglycan hydrolase FlgJ
VHSPRKPWWQQATALVSLGTGGAITGFAFAQGTAAELASPASVPVTLTALDQAAQPSSAHPVSEESVVRAAIVKVASYYARLAQTKTPAEMEALIWQQDSSDGTDHGQSCAAFASMTLQLGAQLAGKQSWVTGGSTYPWPVEDWVDARVDPNPASLNITSVLQDAQGHQRWHPLGDGYQPQPGDWVLFDGHVEVVTQDSGGELSTIGGDSLPNFSVNSHEYSGSLSSHGVQGFVDNGNLPAAAAAASSSGSGSGSSQPASSASQSSSSAGRQATAATPQADQQAEEALAAIPGTATASASSSDGTAPAPAAAAIPGVPSSPASGSSGTSSANAGDAKAPARPQTQPTASIPGLPTAHATATPSAKPAGTPAAQPSAKATTTSPAPSYQRHGTSPATSSAATAVSAAQRAFINQIAPGALAAQRTYGVPAAVTIAQAIDESAWGQSALATQDHNLFGIKGSGPAGSVSLPTQEVQGGETVSTTAQFRVYHDIAESIEDHGKLLAGSGSYSAAMANQDSPNAFANALTGVYATDPNYGSSLIGLMRQYNLYRYDASASAASATPPATASPKSQPHGATQSHPARQAPAAARPTATATSPSRPAPSTSASPGASAASPSPAPVPATSSAPTGSSSPATAPRSTSVPHPFATPSSPAPADSTPSASPGSSLGEAEIPGILGTAASPSASASSSSSAEASTSAAVRSSAPPVDAELTAVYRQASAAPATATTAAHQSTGADQSTATPESTATHQSQAVTHQAAAPKKSAKRKTPGPKARRAAPRYQPQVPPAIKNAFLSSARRPLLRAEFVYRDVAANAGVSWKVLAACDWMQCDAHPRFSPVRGEKLGTVNPDGTVFHTKSEALTQCAHDLVTLAGAVYDIDLTVPMPLSVPELANVFAAYRWGGLLRQHSTSAMEFPYSVQGLTDQFMHMRWPKIADLNAPDKPGSRFRRAFGAVPVVLSLDYPAIVL